jgi:hypothetical protein
MCFSGGNVDDYAETMRRLNLAISDIRKWMFQNKLKLNGDKTEIIFIGTRQQLDKCKTFIRKNQTIGEDTITPVTEVRNLGFQFDEKLSSAAHVKKLTASCYTNIRKISKIRKSLNVETCKIIINGLVTAKLDYCNAALAGTSSALLKKLQAVQNMSCRVIFRLRKYDHISKPLMDLHWLKVPERIDYKICLIVHNCVHGLAPAYLKELLPVVRTQAAMCLRSQSSHKLDIAGCSHSQARKSAFQYVGPSLWNSLPAQLRTITDVNIFKKHLKTFLFTKSHVNAIAF